MFVIYRDASRKWFINFHITQNGHDINPHEILNIFTPFILPIYNNFSSYSLFSANLQCICYVLNINKFSQCLHILLLQSLLTCQPREESINQQLFCRIKTKIIHLQYFPILTESNYLKSF
ncbi:hypothetical protein CDL12_16234 [Handroanthus impetiginosus]|uniref:Uncharacterized protein n=1 Tax=Handroanthus impetiginosus TaxID=429701 RepID=A0A2G9H1K5_9LAMI|nr:hypothetical protein CDL12_16234 [Handroanthus impetiginosus]